MTQIRWVPMNGAWYENKEEFNRHLDTCTRCRTAEDKSELCPVGQALIDAGFKAMQDAIKESNE